MSTTSPPTTPNRGTERHPKTRASSGVEPAAAWAEGVLVVPLLWLVVMGYQVVVMVLKVVNREQPAHPDLPVGGGVAATDSAVNRP